MLHQNNDCIKRIGAMLERIGAMLERIGAMLERACGTIGAFSIGQMASVLYPEIFVTQLGVTCPLVTVTFFGLHHPNRQL